MVPATSAGRGPTHLLESTLKPLNRLRTRQKEGPETSSANRGFYWKLDYYEVKKLLSCPHFDKFRQFGLDVTRGQFTFFILNLFSCHPWEELLHQECII